LAPARVIQLDEKAASMIRAGADIYATLVHYRERLRGLVEISLLHAEEIR
jgi:hypothetical protein